jgi:hypothetical protein
MRGAAMTEEKRGFRFGMVATLLVLVHCSACSDGSATRSSGEPKEPASSSRKQILFTDVGESRNTAAICRSAKDDIASSDRALATAFEEWRSQRDAFYEARKSAFLSGSKETGSPSEISTATNVATINDASASQKDDRSEDDLLDAKKKAFYAALRNAHTTLANYDQIGCVESGDFLKKHREYNDLLGKD